ncbi:MAG: hypothetical protein LUG21_00615 [Clostridiales bacterium]|nr:hypothetical protein [Clostridiales bacterium]
MEHKEEIYSAHGLSEVVTRPDCQNKLYASELIKKASRFIISGLADISIFTCDKSKVSLYEKGGWQEVEGACFIGETKEKPFHSDSLNLTTMMMFISSKGKRNKKILKIQIYFLN